MSKCTAVADSCTWLQLSFLYCSSGLPFAVNSHAPMKFPSWQWPRVKGLIGQTSARPDPAAPALTCMRAQPRNMFSKTDGLGRGVPSYPWNRQSHKKPPVPVPRVFREAPPVPPAGAAPSMPRWSVLGLHPTAPFLVFLGAELVLNCKFPIFWCAENYPLLSIWCSQVWLSPFFGTLPGQEPPGDFRMGPHAKRNADGRRWGPAPIGGHRLKVFW